MGCRFCIRAICQKFFHELDVLPGINSSKLYVNFLAVDRYAVSEPPELLQAFCFFQWMGGELCDVQECFAAKEINSHVAVVGAFLEPLDGFGPAKRNHLSRKVQSFSGMVKDYFDDVGIKEFVASANRRDCCDDGSLFVLCEECNQFCEGGRVDARFIYLPVHDEG